MKTPYHHGNLRAALITAALRTLDDEGKTPSLRALAQTIGVSRNAAYRHFSDVDDLLGEVAAICFAELLGTIEAATRAAQTPRERAFMSCAAYLRYGLQYPARYALMFTSEGASSAHPRAQEESERAFSELTTLAKDNGAAEPEVAAFCAWSILHGGLDLLGRGELPESLEGAQEALLTRITDAAIVHLSGA